ncbi:FxLYD domain-containing protein [Xylella fastidiosa]|uniref:FxLYD domain-containing protein n=1 Tax=Xylella fastidiosa TaxID=2371 RepID=UPI000765A57F|nr:FxLYD domain-containing protein [Xylella fastidiosa]ALR03211.1 hypothetical protein OY18_13005 [Xylella fastidiosa]KXB10240.1 hypothetical protein ADT29_00430 [Xylella fastidiosa]KXB18589.1 hypothetical protein ADT28_00460 [Xylella fastidiosa]MDG5824306.1 FxLYD domain-containing protein [Xylella fastidiosa subsp. pauca]MDG5824346.1 FxLYD domain-containing protein [Xylella fastidiosa subsp. pauca]
MKSIFALLAFMVFSTVASAQQNELVRVENLSTVESTTPQVPDITGNVINIANKKLRHVTVEFNLYDEQNNLVGNAIDVVTNLEPNGKWKFKATTTTPYQRFKLTNVEAYLE